MASLRSSHELLIISALMHSFLELLDCFVELGLGEVLRGLVRRSQRFLPEIRESD